MAHTLSVSEGAPWAVRHLYSAVDRSFEAYLAELTDLLSRPRAAGWADQLTSAPLKSAQDIADALADTRMGELVIVDTHGWADDGGGWLSLTTTSEVVALADIPPGTVGAAVLVFTNCRGARASFLADISRLLIYPATVASHFDEVGVRDHTSVELVRAVLYESAGGDDGEALNAIDRALYNRLRLRTEPWHVGRVRPLPPV